MEDDLRDVAEDASVFAGDAVLRHAAKDLEHDAAHVIGSREFASGFDEFGSEQGIAESRWGLCLASMCQAEVRIAGSERMAATTAAGEKIGTASAGNGRLPENRRWVEVRW